MQTNNSNTLTILLYHGVTDCTSVGIENYSGKHMRAEEFDFEMKYISENCTVLSMDEVADIYTSNGEYPHNAVAVTFDDGFKNNYRVAAPILEKYKVPATFYITSGIINTNIMFWVDKLEDCINNSKNEIIELELDEKKTYPLFSNQEKINALTEIKAFCKLQSQSRKNDIVDIVIEATGHTPDVKNAANYEKMDWDELKAMDRNPLFIIGGHSLYHDILASKPNDQALFQDIDLSIQLLEYHLKHKITHYSYPEGQAHHYNEKTIEILKQKGIVCSPSAIHGINKGKEHDLFNLRRVMVGFNNIPFPFK